MFDLYTDTADVIRLFEFFSPKSDSFELMPKSDFTKKKIKEIDKQMKGLFAKLRRGCFYAGFEGRKFEDCVLYYANSKIDQDRDHIYSMIENIYNDLEEFSGRWTVKRYFTVLLNWNILISSVRANS